MTDVERLKLRAAEIAEREGRRLLDRTPGSESLHIRSVKSLPKGVASNFQAGDPYPVYLRRGSGALVWDVDGNEYLDYRRAHDRDSRHVLRRHRDDVERDRDADERADRERRHRELHARDEQRGIDGCPLLRERDTHDDRRGDERERHRPPRREADEDEPRQHHGHDAPRIDHDPRDGCEAQRQQHAREHRLRDRGRDARDQPAEQRPQPGDHDERRDDEERPHRRRPAALDHSGGGEQRGAGRRPRDGDRHPVPPRERRCRRCPS